MFQIKSSACLILAISLFVTSTLGNSYDHPKFKRSSSGTNVATRKYIVELVQAPNVTVNSFIDFTNSHSDNVRIQRTISHKFLNAVSIGIKEDNIEKEHTTLKLILDHMDVQSVSPIQIYQSSQIDSSKSQLSAHEVDLVSPHRFSQVDRVHSELKLRGEGVFIGIIDTGVDYTHPALGGGFGPGFKIEAGYDLVGDNYTANGDPQESSTPLEQCPETSGASGHGTHVTGIIGGYDPLTNFTGVAPRARLGHWRVGGCADQLASDAILKAMTMAQEAGVHIISMSLGSDQPWAASGTLDSKLLKNIVDSGISVIVSAGNTGFRGAYTVIHPATAPGAFSVASVDNEYHQFDCSFSVQGISTQIPCNLPKNSTTSVKDIKPLIDGIITLPRDDAVHACGPVDLNVKGKVVLLGIGVCDFILQMKNIYDAGAVGAIVYETTERSHIYDIEMHPYLPFVFISHSDSVSIIKGMTTNTLVKFSRDLPSYLFKNEKYATTASWFSSVGPTGDLDLNPHIAAVGQAFYSTIPTNRGSYEFLDGTSMACPYVAGSIALFIQQNGVGKVPPRVVYEKFQNYAFQPNVFNRTSGFLDNPLRSGAGAVQVYDTITQAAHVTPGQISFRDSSTTDDKTQTLTITNHGLEAVTYRLYNNASVAIVPYNRTNSGYKLLAPATNTNEPAQIDFSASELYLAPGQSGSVNVTVHPPKTDPLDHIMYGGYIQFYPSTVGAKALHVPYFGIVGRQNDIPVFQVNSKDFAVALRGEPTVTYNITDTIVLKDSSWVVGVKYVVSVPTIVIKKEILLGQQVLGQVQPVQLYNSATVPGIPERLSWNGEYFNAPLDLSSKLGPTKETSGETETFKVSKGTYHIRVSALKLLGDMNNVDDWDTFTVGPLIVQ
ncbi:peptidase S8/S53 domain-containing protein [Mucor mucedo]|uniref:peptidase S8/S53 domain-containing protein n=1 Tax=Mucor mucedo TaxID=29922 RepID=UPI00221F11F0|nr:peptidase S8/S53 domain-containing protein [Mucor mucedo]KAI7893855.1 peptidase S8/S53 domain-containing protein [Mucor mucedo]